MVIEALTFKLSLDFFVYLKKYKIEVSKIRLGFSDDAGGKTEFTDFSGIPEMELFYQSNYVPFDNCLVGDLVSVELFLGESDLYDFITEYRAEDLTDKFKLTSGSSFDIQGPYLPVGRLLLSTGQLRITENTGMNFLEFIPQEYILRVMHSLGGHKVLGICISLGRYLHQEIMKINFLMMMLLLLMNHLNK